MASLALYGDESETARVFGLGAFIADVGEWRVFQERWRKVLERAGMFDECGTLLPFHMSDFESRFSPFDAWDDEKRARVISTLIEIMALRRNLTEGPFYAAFRKATNSVLVAAIR